MSEPKSQTGMLRSLSTLKAVYLGLGSIVGTGVFVSIALAGGITGPSVLVGGLSVSGLLGALADLGAGAGDPGNRHRVASFGPADLRLKGGNLNHRFCS